MPRVPRYGEGAGGESPRMGVQGDREVTDLGRGDYRPLRFGVGGVVNNAELPEDDGYRAVREFIVDSEVVPPPPPPVPRLALALSILLVCLYSLTTAAVCGTYLDIWASRADGPDIRDIAIAWLFPVGSPIESIVGVTRGLFAWFSGSNQLAVVLTWPVSFLLCLFAAAAQSTLIVAAVNACILTARRLVRRAR